MIISAVFVFICISVFFVYIQPIVPFHEDDWGTLSAWYESILPVSSNNDPARVLPKFIGYIVGNISAYVVYPLLGDYIKSITVVTGIIVSITAI